MKRWILITSVLLASSLAAVADDSGWPMEAMGGGYRVVMYQPQVETWNENDLEARAAVSVTPPDSEEPVFGAVWITARVEVDRDSRVVSFHDIEIPNVRFPDASEESQGKLAAFLEKEMPAWDLDMDLDVLIPLLESAEKVDPRDPGLRNTPPKIVLRDAPTTLVVLDGEPKMLALGEPRKAVEEKIERVANTPATIFHYPKEKTFYLAGGGELWYTASDALGPYEPAGKVPKVILGLVEPPEDDEAEEDGKPPAVLVATEPTEVVVVTGEIEYEPLGEVDLLTVSNADREIIVDMKSRDHYLLLSGRWYVSAGGLEGPWSFVEPDDLPKSFADIPADGDRGHVLAHVPNTLEAQEAMLDATIPQTSGIRRDDHSFEAEYDGPPKFEPVEKLDVTYAVNSPQAVFQVGSRYYACDQGVWYVASSPTGSWAVATEVPDVLYDLPASNPHHNVTYVKVYDVTPEVVYVGYTPGYVGSYVYRGCVVYGTGWYYPGWWGARYYPYHHTWGFGVTFNPWYGWGFGISWSTGPLTISIGSGWGWGASWWGPWGYRPYYPPFYRPIYPGYRPPYYPGYRPPHHRPPHHRPPAARPPIARPPGSTRPGTPAQLPAGARPSTRPATLENNLYARDRNASRSTARPATQDRMRPTPSTRPNDVLTDRSGNVYKRDAKGSWQQRQGGDWRSTPSTREARPSTRPSTRQSGGSSLSRDYAARSRGSARSQQFRSAPRARPTTGGFRGGGGRRH